MKKFVVLAFLLLSQAAFAQSRVLIVDDVGGTSVKAQSFQLLQKLVQQKLGDKVNVSISVGDALYNQDAMISAEQLGAVQICAPGVGLFTGLFPKLTVLSLPYLLTTPAAIKAAVDDPLIGGALFAEMRQKGIEPLGVWLNGPRDVGRTGGKAILWPADLKGVKIRVAPGDVYVSAFKLLGANVTTMSLAQVPTALRQGVLDGVEVTPNAWVSTHLYDITKQVSKTSYIWDFYILSGNKAWWDGMPAATRAAFKDAIDQATAWNWDNVIKENDRAFDVMKQAGVEVDDLTPEQRTAWVNAEKPLWDSIGSKLVSPEVMARITAIGAQYR